MKTNYITILRNEAQILNASGETVRGASLGAAAARIEQLEQLVKAMDEVRTECIDLDHEEDERHQFGEPDAGGYVTCRVCYLNKYQGHD